MGDTTSLCFGLVICEQNRASGFQGQREPQQGSHKPLGFRRAPEGTGPRGGRRWGHAGFQHPVSPSELE